MLQSVSGISGHAVTEVLTDIFEIVEPSVYRPPGERRPRAGV